MLTWAVSGAGLGEFLLRADGLVAATHDSSGGDPELKRRETQNSRPPRSPYVRRSFPLGVRGRFSTILKASRNLPCVDLLEKQFGKSFGWAGRAHDLSRQRLRCRIEEDSTFLNSGQGVENCFYLFAKKLNAVNLQPIFSASGQKDVTVLVNPGKIAGWIPVLLQKPSDRAPRGQVGVEKSRTVDMQFPDLFCFSWLTVFADQCDSVGGHREANRARFIGSGIEGQQTYFYDTKSRIEILSEPSCKALGDLLGERRSSGDGKAHRIERCDIGSDEILVEVRRTVNDCRAIAASNLPPVFAG